MLAYTENVFFLAYSSATTDRIKIYILKNILKNYKKSNHKEKKESEKLEALRIKVHLDRKFKTEKLN